jgi:hypothetical protein
VNVKNIDLGIYPESEPGKRFLFMWGPWLLIGMLLLPGMVEAASSQDIRDLAKAYNRRDEIDIATQILKGENESRTFMLFISTQELELTKSEAETALVEIKKRNAKEIQALCVKVGTSAEQMP